MMRSECDADILWSNVPMVDTGKYGDTAERQPSGRRINVLRNWMLVHNHMMPGRKSHNWSI